MSISSLFPSDAGLDEGRRVTGKEGKGEEGEKGGKLSHTTLIISK